MRWPSGEDRAGDGKDKVLLVNLSGRGDKDMKYRGEN